MCWTWRKIGEPLYVKVKFEFVDERSDYKKLTAMHMYAWKLGLKTGIYYLRTKPKRQHNNLQSTTEGIYSSSSSTTPRGRRVSYVVHKYARKTNIELII